MKCPLTPEDMEYIRENYKEMTDQRLADHCGCGVSSVRNYRVRAGLEKGRAFLAAYAKKTISPAFLANSFRKGHVSANKGRRREEWLTPEQIRKIERTQFQKGSLPHNTKPVGYVSWHYNAGRKVGYYYIKVSDEPGSKMVLLHQHIWEEANGPVPPGKIVVFKDRNPRNCELGNLELVDREENMKRNTIHRYPEELKRQIRLLSKARKTLQDYERNKHK